MCMVAHLELGSTLQAFEACNVALCHLQLIVIRWNVLVFPAARSWQKLWHQLSKYPKAIWTSEKIMKMKKKKQNTGDGLRTSWIDFQLQQFFRQLQALRMVSNGVHDISWLEILSTLTQSRSKADGPSDHLTASLLGWGFVQTESVLHSNTVCHHCRWADIKAILLSRAIPKGHFKRQSLESEFGIVPCWLHSPASSGASFKSKAKSENCTVSLSFQAMRCKEKGKLSIFDSKIFQVSESHEASPFPAFPHVFVRLFS